MAGIALFMLYLYMSTKQVDYYKFGRQALLKEYSYKVERKEFHEVDFPDNIDSQVASPYFMTGTSGILAVVIRYAYIMQEPTFMEMARQLADSLCFKYSTSATLFYGMAGIGNILLDCAYFLQEEKYREWAYIIAQGCLLHEVPTEEGIVFPDIYNNKISVDYGYGSIGILLFLNRLCKSEKENFSFFLDDWRM